MCTASRLMVQLDHSSFCQLVLESTNYLLRKERLECSGNALAELPMLIFLLLLTLVSFGGNLDGNDCQHHGTS